mgnify:CR=1 FL=1
MLDLISAQFVRLLAEIFWVGAAGTGQDAGPGTDFHAVAGGFVSVTPLHLDLTNYDLLEEIRRGR